MNENERKIVSLKASIIGIVVNAFLFIFKFLVGYLSHSISITADSYNNLTDSLGNIISMAGVFLANKPADEKHPYGYGRLEYIAAFVVAFLVVQVGFFTFTGSVKKIFDKVSVVINVDRPF